MMYYTRYRPDYQNSKNEPETGSISGTEKNKVLEGSLVFQEYTIEWIRCS